MCRIKESAISVSLLKYEVTDVSIEKKYITY